MESIRKRLTYANVMSSLAVFLVLGGGAAFAAINLPPNSVGSRQLQPRAVKTGYLDRNAVRTGKVAFEAIRAGKLSKNAVPTNRLRDNAVRTDKIANNAVTGDKVNESTLGTVPDASKLGGKSPGEYVGKSELLWALVDENGDLVAGSGAVSATRFGVGDFQVGFNREVSDCIAEGTATDVTGGAAPLGASARVVGTDNRAQADNTTVDIGLTNVAGAPADPGTLDGFTVTVYC